MAHPETLKTTLSNSADDHSAAGQKEGGWFRVLLMKNLLFSSLLVLLISSAALAENQSIPIDSSLSPDGRIELWIQPGTDEGISSGAAQIREVKTGKLLGKFAWSGFGVKAGATSFEVIWRPDSRFFAIKWEENRGWMTGAVYGRLNNGQWVEVKRPSEDYIKDIVKKCGVSGLYGKGCDVPSKWLPNGDLVFIFADRNLIYDHEDLEKEFMVALRVVDQKSQPLKMAKIISIKLISREETERRLKEQFSNDQD